MFQKHVTLGCNTYLHFFTSFSRSKLLQETFPLLATISISYVLVVVAVILVILKNPPRIPLNQRKTEALSHVCGLHPRHLCGTHDLLLFLSLFLSSEYCFNVHRVLVVGLCKAFFGRAYILFSNLHLRVTS